MFPNRSEAFWRAVAEAAPGKPLRDGLDRIIKARKGAIIVLSAAEPVLDICSGGFELNADFSPQRLAELAKMDGAIIVSSDAARIERANVHLVPDFRVPTTETGTRHRTAERVARSLGVPVITASEDMAVLTVYLNDEKYQLEPISQVLARSNQALQTLERYKTRLAERTAGLTALEVEDSVTVRDVAGVLQRVELVSRIADEVRHYLVELGGDGRLAGLQLKELMAGIEDERLDLIRDYRTLVSQTSSAVASDDRDGAMLELAELDLSDLMNIEGVLQVMGVEDSDLDRQLDPRGYRMLARIPAPLSDDAVDRIVNHFGRFDRLMRATIADLADVEGISAESAAEIKEGISQYVEKSILDRYS